jgi:N-acetylneuraminic acid mutarotase
MNRTVFLLLFIFICGVVHAQYQLNRIADLIDPQRPHSVTFTLGEYGYVIGGMTNEGQPWNILRDVQRYDPINDSWEKLEDFPDYLTEAVSFIIGSKAYVVTGRSIEDNQHKSNKMYVLDTSTFQWEIKVVPPEIMRIRAVGFSLSGKGYICTGIDTNQTKILKDLWEYDPISDSWTKKEDFPGIERYDAACFSLNNKGYITTGSPPGYPGDTGYIVNDMWEYDPQHDTWTQKADFPGLKKTQATGISLGSHGYLFTGGEWWYNATNITFDMSIWEYDQNSDSWAVVDTFQGQPRLAARGFAINNSCYLISGWLMGFPFYDSWEFSTPYTATKEPLPDAGEASVYPNPFRDYFMIRGLDPNATYEVFLYDLKGVRVFYTTTNSGGSKTLRIPIPSFPEGCYLLRVVATDGTAVLSKKLIKRE